MNEQIKLEKILEVTRQMMATDDLNSLLTLITTCSTQLLGAERASLLLYDSSNHELYSEVAVGEVQLRFPADSGIAGATISAGEIINVVDAYADSRFNTAIDRQTGFCTRSILALPLKGFTGQLVGVLQILNKQSGPFDHNDELLATSLAAQAGVCLQRARLMEHYQRKIEMEQAMEIARSIQLGLLPDNAPVIKDFDISGFSLPADRTGGDMYDFIDLEDGRLLMVVADASGHGIGPALIIAETRAMLRAVSQVYQEPSLLLTSVNSFLAEDLDDHFVTCFVALLDPTMHTIRYASAGHGPIICYNKQQNRFLQEMATGLPLGILKDSEYTESRDFQFTPGDFVLVTTDGCFEATAADGTMFGIERVIDCMRQHSSERAEGMLCRLDQDIASFLGAEPPQDDRTGLLIKYTGNQNRMVALNVSYP